MGKRRDVRPKRTQAHQEHHLKKKRVDEGIGEEDQSIVASETRYVCPRLTKTTHTHTLCRYPILFMTAHILVPGAAAAAALVKTSTQQCTRRESASRQVTPQGQPRVGTRLENASGI